MKHKRKDNNKNSILSSLVGKLHWSTPYVFLPHGTSGAFLFFSGIFFLAQAFCFGPNHRLGYDIHGPRPQFLYHGFLLSAVINSLGGILLIKSAPQNLRLPFFLGATFQISYVWFTFRLSSESTKDYNLLYSLLDKLFALQVIIFLSILPMVTILTKLYIFFIPILISTMALSLTFFYPLQLTIWGNEWFECVLQEYPYQIAGFTNYIYLPTLLAFSMIMFGLTLYNRKIVSAPIFAMTFLILNLGILFVTVLTQEIHITNVSTQRLILPCPQINTATQNTCLDNDENNYDTAGDCMVETSSHTSFIDALSQVLDTSSLAKSILAYFGIPLNTPPTY